MFAELLEKVLTETPGALSVTLMGYDGIAIDTKDAPGAEDSSPSPSAAHVELGHIAGQLKRVAESLGAGLVNELAVHTAGLVTILRPVTHEYFIAVSLKPDGNSGKGRYLLRIVAPKLAEEL